MSGAASAQPMTLRSSRLHDTSSIVRNGRECTHHSSTISRGWSPSESWLRMVTSWRLGSNSSALQAIPLGIAQFKSPQRMRNSFAWAMPSPILSISCIRSGRWRTKVRLDLPLPAERNSSNMLLGTTRGCMPFTCHFQVLEESAQPRQASAGHPCSDRGSSQVQSQSCADQRRVGRGATCRDSPC